MQNIYTFIGSNIRKYRALRGMTQETLAEKAQLTSCYISRIETGKRQVSVQTLLTICTTLGVTLDALALPAVDSASNPNTLILPTVMPLTKPQVELLQTLVAATIGFFEEHGGCLEDKTALAEKTPETATDS